MGSVGVVGAGIIGLSSAVCILERDPTVKLTVIADKFTPNTTTTMEELERLSQRDDAGSYLTIYKTTTFDVTDESCEDPFWADLVDGYRHLSQKELAQISKTTKFGYSFTTWFFNGRNYLPWLIERLKSLGGTISKKTINSLDELAGSYDVVVNCSGMGARKLVNDSLVHPIRGQVLRVYAPWIKQAYCLNTKEWHTNGEVVLGGTAYHNNFDTRVNADDTRHILESTSQLVPSLKQARMINAWVGLRPGRTSARLEKEEKRFRDKSGKEACLKVGFWNT
ncbi:D-aspartate oxidase [Acropora cervicornis]|uniref:D-aspartate oxidase n=1 Tax=Acropora cervicornis TaxID=6130 RepID=A0AAD9V236_ACRCE|nr:D-aspartate oxidase [Acropora cervicornis]